MQKKATGALATMGAVGGGGRLRPEAGTEAADAVGVVGAGADAEVRGAALVAVCANAARPSCIAAPTRDALTSSAR